jgi:hypothetical protein
MKSRLVRGVVVTLIVMAIPALALAQGTTSRLTGFIHDKAGSAVAGATVTLSNDGTGSSLTTKPATWYLHL